MEENKLTIYEFIEDWDNAELSENEWQEQMEEAVQKYNEQYQTNYNPYRTVKQYLIWRRKDIDY